MSEPAKGKDDPALQWLFAQARQYPLLNADEERGADQKKWRAIENLQSLLLENSGSRAYLALWAGNVLDNPPKLDNFTTREPYYLLRRDQAGYQPGGKHRKALASLHKALTGQDKQRRAAALLQSLQLPGPLVVGLAATILHEEKPRGVAAALDQWHAVWPTAPGAQTEAADPEYRRQLRRQLNAYHRARDTLVNHNLRLVFSIAGRMRGKGLPYRDLIQDGVVGLIRAAEKFQHQKGYRFSTYAYNWINQAARRSNEDLGAIIRFPTHVNEQISRMHRERIRYRNTHAREPSMTMLAENLEMEPAALERLRTVGNLSVSIDQPIAASNEDGPQWGDTLAGGPFNATASGAEQASLNRCLMDRMTILEPAERTVVAYRWGLNQSLPLSRADIARQMRVSTEWVRQLEGSALAKLKQDKQVLAAYRAQGDGGD